MGTVWLPPKGGAGEPLELKDVASVVIVGANGAGKSRMGAWLDHPNGRNVPSHRVSAQRGLMLSEYVVQLPLRRAEAQLLYGTQEGHQQPHAKVSNRWGGQPVTQQLNDFDHALTLLFAEHSETAIRFRDRFRASAGADVPQDETKLEVALRIWAVVLPHRKLDLRDDTLKVTAPEGESYSSREMSDGERVVLYLIAQCLAAPANAVIILDEPEIHLHQATQARLWDAIEAERPDCVFVYITHDLAFAATRMTATKVWVKAFHGGERWDWEVIQPAGELPEQLVLQILGSRRPVLFVEGTDDGLDAEIYRALLTGRLVIPRGACEAVIDATSAARGLPQLTRANAAGVIDRDHRGDAAVASLPEKVYALQVAEIENLFLLPDVVRYVSRLHKRDAEADLRKVQADVFGALWAELATQTNERAAFQARHALANFPRPKGVSSGADFAAAVSRHTAAIDAAGAYKGG